MKDIEKAIEMIDKVWHPGKYSNEADSELYVDADELNKACELAILGLEEKLNNGWIPCSERLPESIGIDKRVEYLCTQKLHKNLNCVVIAYYGYSKELEKECWYYPDSEYGDCECTGIIAWQPLPEPYKEWEE